MHVMLPFAVAPNVLVLTLRDPDTDENELSEFLRLLNGPTELTISPGTRAGDFIAQFETPLMLLALWRALGAIPFNGEIIEARLYVLSGPYPTPAKKQRGTTAWRMPG
jgi:hypothetical protein